ncbi:uncharacterized protein BO95DRAFT_483949 [Aspergillus brunneoviolaceus CBS 621.78]|uniref:Uncharacterized protein n=1 Tax=Aspergillus brunneoviolaceus CBS 621.78 TaxID=1450534 RepID=A0ACD1G2H1_9EURO|nr:hypothetical protein BO95DRAFT_483949 [Aspergillus brunneoviolaceus CBS 621.78]RAH43466.1 hypothetical protein BO95DRAFT_483949 [Aspergillus brunneoviolaceus CBS 621.78]
MAATLPLELLIQIATFLESTGAPSLRHQELPEELGFDTLTIQLEDYTTDNEVQRDNDRAFQSGIIALFRTLSDWDPGLRLTLQLLISGREETLEPNTYDCTFTGPVPWSFPDEWILAVPFYRASFGHSDPPTLPVVPCMDQLRFSDNSEFDFLSEIWRLNMQEHVKPDHLNYIQARRRGNKLTSTDSQRLGTLSSFEYPWKWSMPGLNLLGCDHDMLSLNLRNLSINLRRLNLDEVSLAADVLFPLDEQGNPLPESLSLHWPHLEVLNLCVPPVLPTGKHSSNMATIHISPSFIGRWVTLHLPERQKELDAIEDWSGIIRDVERGNGNRELLDTEHFQRVLISLGHAARRMPKLTSLDYAIDCSPQFELSVVFIPYESADLILYSKHRPDKRAAMAWNCPFENLPATVGIPWGLTAVISPWPPVWVILCTTFYVVFFSLQ